MRYQWFDELLKADPGAINSQQLRWLLTAHHGSDNVETLLMNFFKGTGIRGLQGILPKNGKIIRPLLFAKKGEIITFAKQNEIQFVEDSSNGSDKYTRNFFRNQLLPSIQKVFPQVEENLMDNIERFRETNMLYEEALHGHLKKLLVKKGEEIHIPVLKLAKSKPLRSIVYEIIKDFGFTSHQAGDVISLLNSGSGKFIASDSHRIIRNRNWLIISPCETKMAQHILHIAEKNLLTR